MLILRLGAGALFWGNVAVTTGRATCEAYSATWNLGTNLAFALGPRRRVLHTSSVRTSQETLRLHNNAQPVNAVWENSRCLL
jgi:hypothetical protein